jgi:hypothetical protein
LKEDYPNRLPIATDTIRIICSIHGVFKIQYGLHKRGQGCSYCSGHYKTTEIFIKEANKIHNNKYDYSETNYINARKYITIICPKHGKFEKIPDLHLNGQGCSYCDNNMVPKGFWNKKNCLTNAKKYESRNEWTKNSSGAYNLARKNGWLEECCAHMKRLQKPNGFWQIKENCIEDAQKYKSPSKWKEHSGRAYQMARENGWLKECSAHMNKKQQKAKGFWQIKENCIEDARKYQNRSEWMRKSSGAYDSARDNEWLEECCAHMVELQKPSGFWTKQRCVEDAKKYETRSEWQKKSKSAYNIAYRNGWLNQCCKYMKNGRKK